MLALSDTAVTDEATHASAANNTSKGMANENRGIIAEQCSLAISAQFR